MVFIIIISKSALDMNNYLVGSKSLYLISRVSKMYLLLFQC